MEEHEEIIDSQSSDREIQPQESKIPSQILEPGIHGKFSKSFKGNVNRIPIHSLNPQTTASGIKKNKLTKGNFTIHPNENRHQPSTSMAGKKWK